MIHIEYDSSNGRIVRYIRKEGAYNFTQRGGTSITSFDENAVDYENLNNYYIQIINQQTTLTARVQPSDESFTILADSVDEIVLDLNRWGGGEIYKLVDGEKVEPPYVLANGDTLAITSNEQTVLEYLVVPPFPTMEYKWIVTCN